MATYAIGDIQGCFASFQQLLEKVSFSLNSDTLWLVGDLVNRGPKSLGTLRFIKGLGRTVRLVLGNHDLFLLAVANGIAALRPKDTIHDILGADDREELIDWLRLQPLHYREGSFLMVHAGLLPQWTVEEATDLAKEVETALHGPDNRLFLQALFQGPAIPWNPSLMGEARLASIARVLTRIRTCTTTGVMSTFSGPPENAPAGFSPWFRFQDRRHGGTTIITGHWAALGLHMQPELLAIDSGCVWGKRLTAVRLEDRTVFQVECADKIRRD
ncbi:MAG TPA: symmetrical bis(5'-nucleosyl)-tetraphosphatase [Nitrospira sp.]